MFKLEIGKQRSVVDLAKLKMYKGTIVYGVPQQTAHTRIAENSEDSKDSKPRYNNAQILALMEHGSIINNIPERELLGPVRKKYKKQIDAELLKVCTLIIQNKPEEADVVMEKLALRIEAWTKKFFTDSDNGWAPNAPITINGGWMRNKTSGKVFYIKGKHSERPLIDTGSLRASIKAIFYKDGRQ